jgi:cytochrome c oxidase assembly factor CtaG
MKLRYTFRLATSLLLVPTLTFAHEGQSPVTPANFWQAWSVEPWVIASLLLTLTIYLLGLRRIRTRVLKRQITSFSAGIAALALTLLSPLHRFGSELFSAHMTQHELLMLVAAPLLVMGQPGTPMLWAFPISSRIKLGKAVKQPVLARTWKAVSSPFSAWIIHGISVWLWHIPFLYQATLESELVHAAQHITFLGTALLFWWTLFHGRSERMTYGAAVVYVFTTAVHTSVLGALLTCTSKLWYPAYVGHTTAWGLSALQDQQLGGLIMWLPAGVVYIGIALWLFAGWLRESDQRLLYTRTSDLMRVPLREGGPDA